jgi:cell filamentation protein
MRNDYQYIDPDYTYTDPETGVLRNLAGITDKKDLLFFESSVVLKRAKELTEKPLTITGAETLLKIHQYLFQDVYHWAGEKRIVEISKQGKPFFPTAFFDKGFAYINSLVEEYRKIDNSDKEKLAHYLANILDSINYLHPFREGNGRAQREFIRLLALEKAYKINLNPPENADIYNRYMSGTINGDIENLTSLILELLT